MTSEEVVDRYFDALARFDLGTIRTLVHDDLEFKGPLTELSTAEDYLRGLEHASTLVQRVDGRSVVREGDHAVQIYDVAIASPPATIRVAEYLRIVGGRIAAIEMILDPRPLMAPQAHQPAG